MWKSEKEQAQQLFAVGDISVEDCSLNKLYSNDFIVAIEKKLRQFAYNMSLLPLDSSSFLAVIKNIESLVLALNHINQQFDGWREC